MHLHKIPLKAKIIVLVIIIVTAGLVVSGKYYYANNLKALNSASTQQISFNIPKGQTINQIASSLQVNHIIRSSWAFKIYVQSTGLENNLQAGTYLLSPNETVAKIAQIIASGNVLESPVTIIPGQTIEQVTNTLLKSGFSLSSVSQALNPKNYLGLPIIADLPANVNTLNGLLFPDTFYKLSTTSASTIIRESLVEMGQKISPAMQLAYAKEGLSVYQAITLASIVENEVSSQSDRNQVAQVFLSRLAQGIPLGSDVSANYGAILNGQTPSLTYDSPYNTLLHPGLPPTPISTVDLSSLRAVAYPAKTNWLYFVTGDNGVTYFESTLAQHNQDVANYCLKLCNLP